MLPSLTAWRHLDSSAKVISKLYFDKSVIFSYLGKSLTPLGVYEAIQGVIIGHSCRFSNFSVPQGVKILPSRANSAYAAESNKSAPRAIDIGNNIGCPQPNMCMGLFDGRNGILDSITLAYSRYRCCSMIGTIPPIGCTEKSNSDIPIADFCLRSGYRPP